VRSITETITTMKPTLSSILLTYAALYPILLLAELFGVRLPDIVSHANALGFFTVIMIGLIMTKEYGRPRGNLKAPSQPGGRSMHPTLLPVSHVFSGNDSAAVQSQGGSTQPHRMTTALSCRIPPHRAVRRPADASNHILTR